MVLSILLAITVIVVMIDVLVGIHRGVKFGLVRLGLWVVGTVICVFIAEGVTSWLLLKIAKVPDMKLFTFDVFGGWMGEYTGTIGNHMTALTVSLSVPVVFVALFLAAKFITWLLYLIVKQIIKKAAKRATAHNAAVDAVTAVKKAEMPDAESTGLDQPYEATLPQSVLNSENGDDFGTFGIYPKESKTVEAYEPEKETDMDTAVTEDGFDILSNDDFSGSDGFEAIANSDPEIEVEESEEEPEAGDEPAGSDEPDDLEADGESLDGFESLARASVEEESKKEAEEKKVKVKPVKVKPVKVKAVKEKKLKKRHSLSLFIMEKTTASSVLGGVLGMFIGLFTCAIIASPVKGLVKVIADKEMAEPTVNLVAALANLDMKQVVDGAFDEDDKKIAIISKNLDLVGDFSIRSEDFVEVFTDLEDSVLHQVYKYSGADFTASAIYDSLVDIKPEDIKIENRGISKYNMAETLGCYAPLIPDLNDILTEINERKGLNFELLDILERGIKHLFDSDGKGAILTEADKLQIANGIVDRFNEILADHFVHYYTNTESPVIEHFERFSEARKGFETSFDLMRRLLRAGMIE
ncbi:MAG: hypothetical protein IKP88_03945 [Lachnospiraceae bacterium]|nr:hypothetical protein [Lachnospiraceae bacterium]